MFDPAPKFLHRLILLYIFFLMPIAVPDTFVDEEIEVLPPPPCGDPTWVSDRECDACIKDNVTCRKIQDMGGPCLQCRDCDRDCTLWGLRHDGAFIVPNAGFVGWLAHSTIRIRADLPPILDAVAQGAADYTLTWLRGLDFTVIPEAEALFNCPFPNIPSYAVYEKWDRRDARDLATAIVFRDLRQKAREDLQPLVLGSIQEDWIKLPQVEDDHNWLFISPGMSWRSYRLDPIPPTAPPTTPSAAPSHVPPLAPTVPAAAVRPPPVASGRISRTASSRSVPHRTTHDKRRPASTSATSARASASVRPSTRASRSALVSSALQSTSARVSTSTRPSYSARTEDAVRWMGFEGITYLLASHASGLATEVEKLAKWADKNAPGASLADTPTSSEEGDHMDT
ncbi:uncharacterized protein BXZ73DRAFT_110813 [Epithele typhae]|uniref:uncharacterized protein n=1 Tax=Epithele typhae TaxID=378194 RepID=UPI002007940F|nr:uncharacterized protein BXZ73DRAFT_110813 [Epithele typhae]KAH9905556.1 hypothetical protein BXZ73DRAFT_110813 [Epithele typhae]